MSKTDPDIETRMKVFPPRPRQMLHMRENVERLRF